MTRLLVPLAAAALLLAARPAAAQYTWAGPFTGSTNWSSASWVGGTPPAGGSATTTLTFGNPAAAISSSYTATNDRGFPFTANRLTFASTGGWVTVRNAAGNGIRFGGADARVVQDGLGNATLGAVGNLFELAADTTVSGTGLGGVRIDGTLVGAGRLTVDYPQPLQYTGAVVLGGFNNTFAGGVTLNAGNLRVADADALGTGPLTVNGGTFGAISPASLANPVTLNADFVIANDTSLTLSGAIAEAGGSRAVRLAAVGGNSFTTFRGANTYTGPTVIAMPPVVTSNAPVSLSLTLSGANGSIALSESVSVAGGGLTLDNRIAGANPNRIGDAAPVTLSNSTLQLIGGTAAGTTERVGRLTGNGQATVLVDATAAGNTGTRLEAAELSRGAARGTFVFVGTSPALGSPAGANVPQIAFAAFDPDQLVGGGGAAGTTTVSVLPYAVGGVSIISSGTDLVTYAAGTGVRPLAAAEYATAIADGTASANNVRLTAVATITRPTAVNALVLGSGSGLSGAGTLTVASGLVVSGSVIVDAATTLNFPREAVVHGGPAVQGRVTAADGLTKTGPGTLRLLNPANAIAGPLTVNGGRVEFLYASALGGASELVLNAGFDGPDTSGLLYASTAAATLTAPVRTRGGIARLGTTGGTPGTVNLTVAGPVSGDGGIIINNGPVIAGDVELTNVNNSYTGPTRVYSGTLVIGSDAVLGNGGMLNLAAQLTGGLRLTGDWTTSRLVNVSTACQINTNGFDATLNGLLTGSGEVTKVGAGRLTLTRPATHSAGVGVYGGELRVSNATGSATGTGRVFLIGAGSTLSGTGTVGGAVTANTGTVVRPGVGGPSAGNPTLTVGEFFFDGSVSVPTAVGGTPAAPTSSRLISTGLFTRATGGSSAATDTLTFALTDDGTLDLSGAAPHTITLVTFGSTADLATANFAATTTNFWFAADPTFTLTATELRLTFVATPVPEPGLVLAAAAAVVGVARGRRRRGSCIR